MMMPTGLPRNPTTATVIGNHQIMVVPIGGGSDKINNNGIPLITALQRASTTNNVVQGNDFNITRNVEPMHISSNDSSITLVETSDSDVNGKPRRHPYMCHFNNSILDYISSRYEIYYNIILIIFILVEKGERNQQTSNSASQNTANNQPRKNTPGRRKKPCLSSRERNVRRIESNERERLRMHGLNIAFPVLTVYFNGTLNTSQGIYSII